MIIPINLQNESYNIIIESGLLGQLSKYVPRGGKTLIVTDSGVPSSYAQTVSTNFANPFVYIIKQGEASKNSKNYLDLLKFMLDNGFTRKDRVIAVGGGVVGDLSGFVASTYMRGVDFYNVPTTFLSQVDSSIGGKVAIDMNGVKNCVGTFYQPKAVFIDPSVLKTLPERLLYTGLVESIKMAATYDAKLFETIENSLDILKDAETIIAGSLNIKKQVVEKDVKEAGLRRVLNFGHTVGHAIESFFDGTLYHGECVGIGMLSLCSEQVADRIKALLEKFELPTTAKANPEVLSNFIWHDKKAVDNHVVAVYVQTLGEFKFVNLTAKDIDKLTEKFA